MVPKTPIPPTLESRFCAACGQVAEDAPEGTLCLYCGNSLQLRGYCPICERRLNLAVGAMCPKHEVVLEPDEPGPKTRSVAVKAFSWVTVRRFPHSLAAEAARIRLEAEGIPTFVEGERMGSPAMYQVATNGVKLQVPAELVDEARVILAQSWSLPSGDADVEDDLDDFDDLENVTEDALPEPSSTRLLIAEALFILILITPLIVWLIVKLSGDHR
jgi:hypothetical protein